MQRGGEDALAALVEVDAHITDEWANEHKAVWIRAKACVGDNLFLKKNEDCREEALTILRQCTDADDLYATCVLGTRLLLYSNNQQSRQEGITLLEKAANHGDRQAMNNLGSAYGDGFGVERDQKKSVEWLERAAECGEIHASATLGGFFSKHGVDADKSRAFQLCVTAADSGHPLALNNLAFCYETGSGVRQDLQMAFSLYQQSFSISHDAATMNKLARCYTYGIGTKRDIPKATELFHKAIEKGDSDAMLNLGQLLFSGEIMERDEEKGIGLMKRAAACGKEEAKILLSMTGRDSCPFQVLQQDTTMPSFMKLFMVGLSYLLDESMKNPQKAFDSFQDAARDCECHLGSIQSQDKIHDPIFAQAVLTYYGLILNELGRCYQEGLGVSKNEKKSLSYFEHGASFESPPCLVSLGKCFEKGIGVEPNMKKAFAIFKRVSGTQDPDGLYNLGRCYENGIGVEVNQAKALELYQRASKLGHPEAKERLQALEQDTSSD